MTADTPDQPIVGEYEDHRRGTEAHVKVCRFDAGLQKFHDIQWCGFCILICKRDADGGSNCSCEKREFKKRGLSPGGTV